MRYLDRMAKEAQTFVSLHFIFRESQLRQEAVYGWSCGRLYHVYPGGRCVDRTAAVSPEQIKENKHDD